MSPQNYMPFNYKFVYIVKVFDFSEKYGLGYLLSNNSAGVCFNDNTQATLKLKDRQLDYIDKNN